MRDVTFAPRLRALFAAAAYDRKDLARSVGVSIPTVLQWEDGDRVPDVNQLRKVAMYFGLPCEFFLENLPEPRGKEEPMRNWQIADRLGLSEGTVERLMELAETAPGKVLDGVDDAIFSTLEAVSATKEEWSRL